MASAWDGTGISYLVPSTFAASAGVTMAKNEGRDAHDRDGGGARTAWTTPEPSSDIVSTYRCRRWMSSRKMS
jgi:hypothetical protein